MLSVLGSTTATNLLTGSPISVNAVPNLFLSDLNEMNFFDRVKNFLIHGVDLAVIELLNFKMQKVYECVELSSFQILLIFKTFHLNIVVHF